MGDITGSHADDLSDLNLDCFGDETSELQQRWQLYGGADGVGAAKELERGYEAGLWEFAEETPLVAAEAMWKRMEPRMIRFRSQGARDSEPLWYLADRIAADILARHGVKLEVCRWSGKARLG